jgi:hypothetical protein
MARFKQTLWLSLRKSVLTLTHSHTHTHRMSASRSMYANSTICRVHYKELCSVNCYVYTAMQLLFKATFVYTKCSENEYVSPRVLQGNSGVQIPVIFPENVIKEMRGCKVYPTNYFSRNKRNKAHTSETLFLRLVYLAYVNVKVIPMLN